MRAVDGISLTVAAGELVALVGESGCGKTTTAQAVMRMLVPRSGSVEIDGQRHRAALGARAAAGAARGADRLPGSRTSRSTRATACATPWPSRS